MPFGVYNIISDKKPFCDYAGIAGLSRSGFLLNVRNSLNHLCFKILCEIDCGSQELRGNIGNYWSSGYKMLLSETPFARRSVF